MISINNSCDKTILGFNVGHNASCTLLHNNKIISIAEERLNRKKNSEGYLYSINYCLKELNLSIDDVDLFVSSNYGLPLNDEYVGDLKPFVKDTKKFITVDHHLSHAYSSYFLSEFDEALVIVIDGLGNYNDTESYYIAKGYDIKKIGGNNSKRDRYKGIGRTYETFSNFCGYSAQQAGKTMGLSAWGKMKYPNVRLYDINDNLEISSKCEGKYIDGALNFIQKNNLNFGEQCSGFENRDAAYYVQYETENIILELVKRLYDKYKIKNICLAGGVFLNGIVNQRILDETPIENVFVAPCCDDTGESFGNMLYGYHKFFNKKEKIKLDTAYLGREYTENEILDVLDKKQKIFTLPYEVKSCKFSYHKSDKLEQEVAEILSKGNIIGWFQGASEIGPRALGNRSILCSAYPKEMKDILNEKIKHRENFRPFAPSIIEERVSEFFKINDPSPYMLRVPKCNENAKNKIPATLQVDYTGRVQSVNKNTNPRFYNLLTEYDKITNIPVLLNTSFNDNNEPIVETPKDAMVMFCKSK